MAMSPPFVSCVWFLVAVTVFLSPALELSSVDAVQSPKPPLLCDCLDCQPCPEPPPPPPACECSEGSCRCPEGCKCGLFGEPPVKGCDCGDRTCLCKEQCQSCPSELPPPPPPPPPPIVPCSPEGYCECPKSCQCIVFKDPPGGGCACGDIVYSCPDECPKCPPAAEEPPPPPPACPCSEAGYCQCLNRSCTCGKTLNGTGCFDCKDPSNSCTCPDKCPKCEPVISNPPPVAFIKLCECSESQHCVCPQGCSCSLQDTKTCVDASNAVCCNCPASDTGCSSCQA